jgi:hypothetical protein
MLSSIVFADRAIGTRAAADSQAATSNRAALAFSYPEGMKTYIRMMGTFLIPHASGAAEIRRRDGRTEIKLKMANLVYPQNLGDFYTIYILWALTPDGQTTSLAEIPMRSEFSVEAAASHQTFALIITAEPHAEVRLPSPVVLAENAQHRKTSGAAPMRRIGYRGCDGILYMAPLPKTAGADEQTPLFVLGARRAVEIARRARGGRLAEAELQQAESRLAELEQIWPLRLQDEGAYVELARNVMRLAERARSLAMERASQKGRC